MPLLYTVLIGLAAGAHSSTWGMYKDAPHEGFTWWKYFRSTLFAAGVAVLVHQWLQPEAFTASWLVVLFGVIYVVERAVAEVYKTFIRVQDQSKYTIPMQLAVLGRPVESYPLRLAVGAAYVGGALLVMTGVQAVQRANPAPALVVVLLLGAAGGWISAFGGAWKDAPIEGFQTLKFFRSPLMASFYAFVVGHFTTNLVVVALAATGYVIMTTETYKTFFFPSKPRGKFQGKPVLFHDWLVKRQYFVPLYVAIWAVVIGAFVLAFSQPHEGLVRVF
jgi:hypothetical protein